MEVIKVDNLTKDYGQGRGVFDISFAIPQGEVFGFLGPNGAGKTTTIRQILGFIKPDSGFVYINGMGVWGNSHITNRNIGYIPGEINFPEKTTGMDLIKWLAKFSGVKNLKKAEQLLDIMELKNSDSDIKRMSKGMKQKIGIVCAFMHDPQIIIMDEPTSGLDPLMQEIFVDLVKKEKAAGKTILLSSHIFSEVEKTCDRVSIIKEGKIVTSLRMDEIRHPHFKTFKVKFSKPDESRRMAQENLNFAEINHEKNRVKVTVNDSDIKGFVAVLLNYEIEYLTEIRPTLEDHFMGFYSTKKEV